VAAIATYPPRRSSGAVTSAAPAAGSRNAIASGNARPRPTTCPDRPGIDPVELAQRVARHGALNARGLTRWLVAERLAEIGADGLLRPTGRTVGIADALETR
jgi:hypothetical protein